MSICCDRRRRKGRRTPARYSTYQRLPVRSCQRGNYVSISDGGMHIEDLEIWEARTHVCQLALASSSALVSVFRDIQGGMTLACF